MLLQGMIALCSAFGLACFLGLAAVSLLRPISGSGTWIVVSGRKDGASLERDVRGLIWLRGIGFLSCPIAIVDIDLTADGRKMASYLVDRWPAVTLCPADRLSDLTCEERISHPSSSAG